MSVSWLVGRSACHNFFQITLPFSHGLFLQFDGEGGTVDGGDVSLKDVGQDLGHRDVQQVGDGHKLLVNDGRNNDTNVTLSSKEMGLTSM